MTLPTDTPAHPPPDASRSPRSRRHRRLGLGAVLAVLSPLVPTIGLVSPSAVAHEYTVGELEIRHPYAPPTPPGVASAAGYIVVVNTGTESDRLLGGTAPFADGIEIHRTTVEDDVSRMRRLDTGLEIPPGATVRLDPGETHLMFAGLDTALAEGERRPVTLAFERAGEVEVEFAIERDGGADAPVEHEGMDHEGADHGEMDHGEMDHGEMDHGEMDHDWMPHDAGS